ncbi:MAG: hypothetical protein QOD40_1715 [Alphaproteobacteria bacterium]|jgi:hypothetical protein|nr:hypothetical protein [Alphaproteobacteria bacterium]
MPRDTDRPATGRGLVVWSGESRPAARSDNPRDVVRVAAPIVPPGPPAPPNVPVSRPKQARVVASSPPSSANHAPPPANPTFVPLRPVPTHPPVTWSEPQRVAMVDYFTPQYPTSHPPVFAPLPEAPSAPIATAYRPFPTTPPNDWPECATDFRVCRGTGTGGCLNGTCELCLAENKGIFQRLLEFLYGLVKRGVSKAVALFRT